MIRIVLADDHAVVREGIKAVLRSHADLSVVGEAADGEQAVGIVLDCRPDVLLLDLTMPGVNGLEIIARLRLAVPTTRILILSMHSAPEYVRPVMRAGAQGYLVKGSGIDDLIQAIHAVHEGREFLDPRAREALDLQLSNELERLTAREKEVLTLVAGGATNREVARQLGISPKTVDAHRTSLMSKLDLHNAQALTLFAIRHGLIEDAPDAPQRR